MKQQSTAKDVVDSYNRALAARDFAAARRLMADDLRFEGPIDKFQRADDYLKAITGLYGMVKGVEHQATIGEGDEVAVFYLLDTPVAKAPVAEWYTVRGGKVPRGQGAVVGVDDVFSRGSLLHARDGTDGGATATLPARRIPKPRSRDAMSR